MTEELSAERAARVRGRFKMGRLDSMGRSFWEHWRPEDSALLVGMYSSFILLFLEPSLWSDNWPEDLISFHVPGWIALALLLILPFNSWLLDRFLASKTAGDDTLPRWLLALRFLALTPPLFSLHTISLWKKVLERRTAAGRPASAYAAPLDLSRSHWRLASRLQPRALYRTGFLFVWIAVSLLPVLVWALWLARATWLGVWHRPLILGTCVFLHLVSAVSMGLQIQPDIQKGSITRWRKTLLLIVPFLWLLAIPGMVAGFAILLAAKPADDSLSWKIHARRTGVNRDRHWQELQGHLQQRWQERPWFTQWRRPMGLSSPTSSGRRDAELTAFYRVKTLLLVFESMSLSVFIFHRVPTVIHPALWIAAFLAGMGLALQIVGLSARLLRLSRLEENLVRHPYGRYLLLTQVAFLAGTYAGAVLTQISIEQFGFLLGLSAALFAALTALFFLSPGISSKGPDMALWALLYLALAALGGIIALQGEDWRPGLLLFLRISAVLSPLWSLGLFLVLGGWLLRPFSWRHVLDRKIPRRFRVVLAFVALTAALPLGGLAIPFWIYARHRLWPRYEPLLPGNLV